MNSSIPFRQNSGHGSSKFRQKLRRFFPIVSMLSNGYNCSDFFVDMLAGITVGLTTIPQSIAFAAIADLPLQYGLYSAFMGPFMYMIFGTVPVVAIGPTTLMALVVKKYTAIHPGYAPFLALCNGIIILTCALLRLGSLIDFVSVPVISAYTSAASITIVANQVKPLLGLNFVKNSELPELLKTLTNIFGNINTLRWQDSLLGMSTIIFLLFLKELPGLKCVQGRRYDYRRSWVKTAVWLLSVSRNAVVVIFCSCLAYAANGPDPSAPTFVVTGEIPGGLPKIDLPLFGINRTETVDNPTFSDVMSEIQSVLVTLPLVTILCVIAIAKAFSDKATIDASQELIAIGAGNLFGSFCQSMPVTASFGRTAVCSASGGKSTLNEMITGLVSILALIFMMPYCAFIPKTTLAAVIICAVVFNIDFKIAISLWATKKADLIPAGITLFGCLFWSLEYGILAGIGINLVLVLYHAAKPKVTSTVEQVSTPFSDGSMDILWIRIDHGVVFPAVPHIQTKIEEILEAMLQMETGTGSKIPILFDLRNIDILDFTAATAIKDLLVFYEKQGHKVIVYRLRESLVTVLKNCNSKKLRCKFASSKEDINTSGEDAPLIF